MKTIKTVLFGAVLSVFSGCATQNTSNHSLSYPSIYRPEQFIVGLYDVKFDQNKDGTLDGDEHRMLINTFDLNNDGVINYMESRVAVNIHSEIRGLELIKDGRVNEKVSVAIRANLLKLATIAAMPPRQQRQQSEWQKASEWEMRRAASDLGRLIGEQLAK
jgi:hypothetical protein